MKTVSFQGSSLTVGQRRMLDQQRHVRAFMNPVLQDQVEATVKLLDQRKEQGAKPEQIWFFESESFGTLSVAEWMGYTYESSRLPESPVPYT